jgi:hypothetical protein
MRPYWWRDTKNPAEKLMMTEHPSPIPHEQIALRAQELWEADGRPEGKADEHWLQAENELLSHIAQLAAATPPPAVPMIAGIS